VDPGLSATATLAGSRHRGPALDEVAGAVGATMPNADDGPGRLCASVRALVPRVAERLGHAGSDPIGRTAAANRTEAIAFTPGAGVSVARSDPGLPIDLEAPGEVVIALALPLLLPPGDGGRRADRVLTAPVLPAVAYSVAGGAPVRGALRDRGVPPAVVDRPWVRGAAEGGAVATTVHLPAPGRRHLALMSARRRSTPRRAQPPRDRAEVRRGPRQPPTARHPPAPAGTAVRGVPILETSRRSREGALPGARGLPNLAHCPTGLPCIPGRFGPPAAVLAQELGLDVAGQVSVAGSDTAPPAWWAQPPPTLERRDPAGKGAPDGEPALALLSGGHRPPPVTPGLELGVRSSSGPAPAS
jgi:hypothetical protein